MSLLLQYFTLHIPPIRMQGMAEGLHFSDFHLECNDRIGEPHYTHECVCVCCGAYWRSRSHVCDPQA